MPKRSIDSIAPIDLRATLRHQAAGARDPAFRMLRDEVLVATRLPDGPAAIRLTGRGKRIEVEAWGPGAPQALQRAPGIIGADDDPAGFPMRDPVVRRLARRYPGVRITRSQSVFEIAIRTVVTQKVTGREAKSSYRRLAEAVGEPAPGPGNLLLPPDPAVLGNMAYHRFHPFGIERKRAVTLIGIARHAGRLQEAADLPLSEARARLQAVPGIGAWTAAKVALTALGDPDAVPVGDYNLPNAVAWLLAGEPRADDDRMLELLEPYTGHRGRVIRLVQASGENAPRFGPRRPLRRFERS